MSEADPVKEALTREAEKGAGLAHLDAELEVAANGAGVSGAFEYTTLDRLDDALSRNDEAFYRGIGAAEFVILPRFC